MNTRRNNLFFFLNMTIFPYLTNLPNVQIELATDLLKERLYISSLIMS